MGNFLLLSFALLCSASFVHATQLPSVHDDTFTSIQFCQVESGIQTISPLPSSYSDHWVATDALGRSLPQHKDTGPPRQGKYVGIFYFLWNGNHSQKVYDISKILRQPEGQRAWGPKSATHFGCEPEVGYFHSSDPWVIRRDMQMLANAGIDFLYLDVTNRLIYEPTTRQLLDTILQMRLQGIRVPQVTFVTNAASGVTMNQIYDTFYTEPKYASLWFNWEEKPLIFGILDDPELRPELRRYFNIKRSWAWTNARKELNHWQWLDTWPQDYGWGKSPDDPDQIPVSTGSHASNSIGKSYQYRTKSTSPVLPDYTTEDTHRGLFFEEQWQRAHEVDPKVVMVTQWNEWIAQRFVKEQQPKVFAGRPQMVDNTWFVDIFSPEFSRDIAPMRAGYTDNYYYQMVSHIRRFKGVSKPPSRSSPRDIQIDGEFDDWKDVPVNYRDPIGDTMHRNFRGTDPKTTYKNTFGRNDILTCKVVEGGDSVHFQVTTAKLLTPHTDPYWMILLLDTDQKTSTGWQGYELAANWNASSNSSSTYAKWTEQQWEVMGKINIAYSDNQLELSIANSIFPRKSGQGFDFKWADNADLQSIESLFLQGDVAPDRRFNFRY